MLIFFLLFVAVCFWGISRPDGGGFVPDYMSKTKSTAVKGIFVILVFFRHFVNYNHLGPWQSDSVIVSFIRAIGPLMVTMFLFYSGYGVMESIKNKGWTYVKNMPVQRILRVLFEFDIAVVLYILLNWALGIRMTAVQIMKSFVALATVGNSNWYIVAIIACYLFTYLSFSLWRKNNVISLALTSILCIGFSFVIRNFYDGENYQTMICYAAGLWFSLKQKGIEQIIRRGSRYYLAFGIVAVLFIAAAGSTPSYVLFAIKALSFTGIIVLLTMNVTFGNPILNLLGRWVFSFYILQRLPMRLVNSLGFMGSNVYLSFVFCLAATIGLAWAFQHLLKQIDHLFVLACRH